jgi:hypothetical protein
MSLSRPLALILGSALLALASSAPARAQLPIGGEFPLVPGAATSPLRGGRVATAPSGDFVVVFYRTETNGTTSLVSRTYDALGAPRGGPFTIASASGLSAGSVASRGTAGYVVAWEASTGVRTTVSARRLDPSGAPDGPAFTMPSGTGTSDRAPSVAGEAGGGFLAVWSSATGGGQPDALFGRRFDASGTPSGPEFRVSDGQVLKLGTSLALAGDGSFVVGWGDYPGGTGSHAMARRFAADGTPLTPQLSIDPDAMHTGLARVASDAAGNFIVVWQTGVSIHARRYEAGGSPATADLLVASNGQLDGSLNVDADAEGNFIVVWDGRPTAPVGDEVWARRFGADGVVGPLVRVSGHERRYSSGSDLAMGADGRAVVVWSSAVAPQQGARPVGRRFGPVAPVSATVDDTAPGVGDGNHVLEPGETALLAPQWRVQGAAPQVLQGRASVPTGADAVAYTLLDGAAAYAPIADGSAGTCLDTGDCYALTVNAAARPGRHWDLVLREDVSAAKSESTWWRLHVGDSFHDVPRESPFYRFVETALHRGVTGGCAETLFCPDAPATRAQVAVFGLLAREGPGYQPWAACYPGSERFGDVPAGSPFCSWIQEQSAAGVMAGCGGGQFCPDAAISREQIAVVLLRTADAAADPPACTAGRERFADVPASSPFCRWIEEMARRRVVSGCGDGRYCPQAPVTRGQLAVFLTQAFGLQLYTP